MVITTGKAYAEILRTAEERRSDLIVIGIRGRSAMGRLLVGSAARHVVRGARCPRVRPLPPGRVLFLPGRPLEELWGRQALGAVR